MKCEQHACENEAESAFLWPGDGLRAACTAHTHKASCLADAMGFKLAVYSVTLAIAERADQTVALLGGEP